jgi:hypothetical protein
MCELTAVPAERKTEKLGSSAFGGSLLGSVLLVVTGGFRLGCVAESENGANTMYDLHRRRLGHGLLQPGPS